MAVLRAFIAIDLSPDIRNEINRVGQELHQRLPGVNVRWVSGKNVHLTLKFLGDVSEENLELLKKMVMVESSAHIAFEISVGEVGAFPSPRRPRVIWIGVAAPAELNHLQHRIETESIHLGYPSEDRPFSPHLTIGRVNRNASSYDIQLISQVITTSNVGFLGAEQVRAVCLFQSNLKPDGAVYTQLFSAPLMVAQ